MTTEERPERVERTQNEEDVEGEETEVVEQPLPSAPVYSGTPDEPERVPSETETVSTDPEE